jgi:hypothetical protein
MSTIASMTPTSSQPRFGAMGLSGWRHSDAFPDPYADYASTVMPEAIPNILRWCEFIFTRNGVYREAIRRTVNYFSTDLVITGDDASREEKEKYKEFFSLKLDIKNDVNEALTNYSCYGNDFASFHVPFRRWLSCPRCFAEFPLRTVKNTPAFHFEWSNYEFHAECPSCAVGAGYRGAWNHIDRRGNEESAVSVRHWDPHQIEIIYDIYSGKTEYVWKIPQEYREDVRKGILITLENAPWEVVQAVKADQAFLFNPDTIYHMKDPTLAGIRNRGWGISRVITNFSQAWYVQVLHRYNEALALDYIIPFRVITPAAKSGSADAASQDPIVGMNGQHFVSRVRTMLRNRKRDPAGWNIMPFPIEYQALGGEATQLMPKDILDQGVDNLLSAAGVPPGLYKMDLTAANAPPALRTFEVTNAPLVHNINSYVRWLANKVSDRFNWEPITAQWMPVSHADDMQKQMAKLQLMMGRQISQSTGMKAIGLDFQDEQKSMLEEEKFVAEESQAMQEQVANEQGAAGGAAGGAGASPAGGAGGGGAGAGAGPAAGAGGASGTVSPPEVLSKAQEISKQIAAMPDGQRQSELINLRKADPNLHALVKSQLEDIDRDAERQGGDLVKQQRLGKQGAAYSGIINRVPGRPGRAIELD